MKIPKTTKEEPYIEFRIHKNGKITLIKTAAWYGGINYGFISSIGYSGNSCKPKYLNRYIDAFKKRKEKELEKEILKLQKQLKHLRRIK